MARSRITLSLDLDQKLMILRYIGDLAGDEVNLNVMQQLVTVPEVWNFDSMIDMRRYHGTILFSEIEELSASWNGLVQGRDSGKSTAIISDDPLVRARLSSTQSLFPLRVIENFNTFDEGLDWIKSRREESHDLLSA